MEVTPEQWSHMFATASHGDGFAVDHIIEGKLNGRLPKHLEDEFEERCFLFWSRDGPYTDEIRASCAMHDPEERAALRDENAARLDVRFIDPSSMLRFIGIGLEGNYDISISFHPESRKAYRVHIREETDDDEMDLYKKSKLWEATGYKLVREWKVRPRVASVRTIGTSSMRTSASSAEPADRISKGRSVVYTLETVGKTVQNKSGRWLKKAEVDLTVHMGLREPEVDVKDSASVMKVATLAFARPLATDAEGHRVRIASKVDMRSSGGLCSLVDSDVGKSNGVLDVMEYRNGQFGDSSFDCGSTDVFDLGTRPGSAHSSSTFWVLRSSDVRSFLIKVEHELEEMKGDSNGGLKEKFVRLFSTDAGATSKSRTVVCSRVLKVYVMSDLSFMDYLETAGIMRRIRKNNCSWNKTREVNFTVQRANLVASARF